MFQKAILFTILILALGVSACVPAPAAPTPTPSSEGAESAQTEAVAAARQALANSLEISADEIGVEEAEAVVWSDSCLGLGGPAESCLRADTPGWRVVLRVGGTLYEVRTDETGQQVRVADERANSEETGIPGPEMEGAVLFFQRSGGITGELMTVRIYPDGTIERAQGEPALDMPVDTATIDPATVEALMTALEEAGYFDLDRTYLPDDLCCDRYLYLVGVERGETVHTVEALDATPDTPDALWTSMQLIEEAVAQAFAE